MNKIDSDSIKEGTRAEDLFKVTAKKKGYEAQKTGRNENIYDHIDYWLTRGKKKKSFDVKAMKRTSRSNKTTQASWIWIEFKNVRGNDGWLYGKANFIAFESINSFLVVDRKKLVKLSEKLVDLNKVVHSAREAKYAAYTRRGREDVISMIHVDDIKKNIEYWEWEK